MAVCTPDLPIVTPILPDNSGEVILDVVDKYKKLMAASTGEDSLYELSKKTMFEYSKDLNMTDSERMDIVAGQITQMTVGLTSHAMSQSLAWAKEDATVGYETAKIDAETILTQARAEVEAVNKCKAENESNLVCANTTAIIAGSLRENGRVLAYEDDNKCIPTALMEEGLKYEQTLQVNGSTYQILADAYRKSGIVQIGVEGGTRKGISSDKEDPGHTATQTAVANRQIVSFEDSKRNHAVNASSQTIGQLIAADAPLADEIVQNYNKGMEYLLADSVPVIPGGYVSLSAVAIDWTIAGTDNVDNPSGDAGNLIPNTVPDPDLPADYQITTAAVFGIDSNARNGDSVMLRVDGGEYFSRHTIDSTDLTALHVLLTFPTVKYDPLGTALMTYRVEAYIQDLAGNQSTPDVYDITVRYVPYG